MRGVLGVICDSEYNVMWSEHSELMKNGYLVKEMNILESTQNPLADKKLLG